MSVPHPFRRLSLDLKLIASYLLILGIGGVAISVVGSWIVAATMRREAQRTVTHDAALTVALYGPALRDAVARGDGAPLVASVGRRLGTGSGEVVALFRGDACIASAPGGLLRAGAPAPRPARAAVLVRGGAWQGRTFLGGDAYLGAFVPVGGPPGPPTGMLYVGLNEDTYAATRNRVISSFFAIATIGFALVIAITYRMIQKQTRPIRQMVEATRSVAAGRFDPLVAVEPEGEVALLAESFNHMQRSLAQMRSDLEEAARTLEDKVRVRGEELAKMQARMAQSERLAAIGVLAAGVAHEINNPLGGILALTGLTLEDLPAKDPRRENLEEVVRQTRRCSDIVKHLLEFSRQHQVAAEELDVNQLLEKTLALLERQSIFHNVRVERDLGPGLPTVVADRSQLQQVFVNILMNAVQAMAERGTIVIGSRHDTVRDEVVLRFRDSGCGILPEQVDRIFDPFFTTKASGLGTGLGLSIAYGIVSRHQGTIEVESVPGHGATFTIRLPVKPASLVASPVCGLEPVSLARDGDAR